MAVAVILINYQNPEDTIECLDSIVIAGGLSEKIILIENGSKDDCVEVLTEYIKKTNSKIELVINKNNIGFASGCNLGIQIALSSHCDFILLLNNDVVVPLNFFKELNTAISDNPDAILTGALLDFKSGKVACSIGQLRKTNLVVKHITKLPNEVYNPVTFISGGLMLIPAKVFLKIGKFRDDFFMYCEDQEFCFRASMADIKLLFASKIVARHKVAASSRKNNVPKAYYGYRNQTRIVWENGTFLNKIFYLGFLFSQIPGLLRNPKIIPEFINGIFDGIQGNLGQYKRI